MTTDVERVAATGGAPAVGFDHAAAEAVLTAIRAAVAQAGAYAVAVGLAADEATVGWEGGHRDEFEQARDVLHRRALAAVEALHVARRGVLAAVDDANARQVVANRVAAEGIIGTGPPG